ncbi:MAG TPA: hypothetical protein VHL14_04315, partial [Steroidobacteraceae bacterium]|nr:hypothetical protein [Steroidobacteraceae bacterium]
ASSRNGVLDLFDKHHDANAFTRAATLAWTQAQVQLRHLGIVQEEAILFQRLAGYVLYANAALRPSSDTIQRGGGTASALWSQSISGDIPVVLLRIDDLADIGIVRQLLQAHEYWQLRQLAVDIVILNERAASYVQDLQNALETLARMSQSRLHVAGIDGGTSKAKGSVFVLRTDLISAETRGVLSAVARIVLVAQRGSLAEQLERRMQLPHVPLQPQTRSQHAVIHGRTSSLQNLEFFNGLGGFTADGREYVTCLDAGQATPAPWINVIANAQFGFQVAVEGSGYTWSVNSRENQLTQWSNDPIVDRPGEVLYVRDEETGELWGPTITPIRDAIAPYYARHGQGYSSFEHQAHDIALELLMYVPLNDSIKICRLKIKNTSNRRRRLSITAYIEWVLGTSRAVSAPFIVTEMDAITGAMFARNPWSTVYGSRVAFAGLHGQQSQQKNQWTADRCEFLGRHGRLERPAALAIKAPLSKRTGAGLDPCCALQTFIELERDQTTEVVLLLGEAASSAEAQALLAQYRSADLDAVLQQVKDYWDEVLGK